MGYLKHAKMIEKEPKEPKERKSEPKGGLKRAKKKIKIKPN